MAEALANQPERGGLTIERRHTRPGEPPLDPVAWERRTARIGGAGGRVVFEQTDVEFPESWSQQATNVVASRYFRGTLGTPERESSVRELITRVAGTIARWGREDGLFASDTDAEAFEDELTWLLVHQRMAFNSPVWFNVGIEAHPQCSACFINSVEDSMESILDLAKTEGLLFKYGSGTGTNLSPIRSSRESLSGGGQATGPLSFMRGYDAFAGAIKSGGKTRRAAKMVILDADHLDVGAFIDSKAAEERKAHALIQAGYDPSFGGEAYRSVAFQNANHSVRVTDAFMQAVVLDGDWTLYGVKDPAVRETVRARDLFARMAEAAWACGDPGLQFDSTINTWHTCPASGRINASNPCSEYMFLDDSACNLASLNLMRFVDLPETPGEIPVFDTEAFEHAVRLTIIAQEILVGHASYPTPRIAANSHRYRPLGLGYANLGALLMSMGLPYDSDEGRATAAAVTALMGGAAYATSAELAAQLGPFEGFEPNASAMRQVITRHAAAVGEIDAARAPAPVLAAASRAWQRAVDEGAGSGYRNAQATVLAPTGTIAFMMDCDTTGVEPDIALVKYKQLAGGGTLRIVNRSVPRALRALGYDEERIREIAEHIEENDTIEGAPGLKEVHLPVFDCAFRAPGGTRSISPRGHLRMMAAVQPFLSGAISKTVNLPHDATPEDIESLYELAWQSGLKAIAVYRDGCKRAQPLTTRQVAAATGLPPEPQRTRLPDERQGLTHKFDIAGHEGYLTVGLYPDGRPGEIFIKMAKQGSTISGLMDAFAMSISVALQHGVPLDTLSRKFIGTRFEPSGFTGHPQIPMARSLMDYLFRWLTLKFPTVTSDTSTLISTPAALEAAEGPKAPRAALPAPAYQEDAPPCPDCGTLMVPSASCYRCTNCGATSGCS